MSTLPERLAALRALRPPHPSLAEGFFGKVRDVVIVASSSRGGSSIFTEILRKSRHLVHFRAEVNPFLLLGGLGHPHTGTGSDLLTAQTPIPDRAGMEAEMARDVGRYARGRSNPERQAMDLAWRLSIQWPHLEIDPAQVADAWRGGPDFAEAFLAFLARESRTAPLARNSGGLTGLVM